MIKRERRSKDACSRPRFTSFILFFYFVGKNSKSQDIQSASASVKANYKRPTEAQCDI